jgi:hypothetical protein
VALSRGDLARARAWVARRVGLGRPAPEPVTVLAELRVARLRRNRLSQRPGEAPASPTAPAAIAAPPAPAAEAQSPPNAPAGETLAERLARRRRGS